MISLVLFVLALLVALKWGGMVFVGDYYDVTALNATNGETIWNVYLSREVNNPGITYAYGQIYVSTEAGVLYVLKPRQERNYPTTNSEHLQCIPRQPPTTACYS